MQDHGTHGRLGVNSRERVWQPSVTQHPRPQAACGRQHVAAVKTRSAGQPAAHMCSPLSMLQTRSKLASANGCCSASATWKRTRSARPCSAASAFARCACHARRAGPCESAAACCRSPSDPAGTALAHTVSRSKTPGACSYARAGQCDSVGVVAPSTCTGLSVIPRAAQPNLRAMCLLLPPMPQPTSNTCGAARRSSAVRGHSG